MSIDTSLRSRLHMYGVVEVAQERLAAKLDTNRDGDADAAPQNTSDAARIFEPLHAGQIAMFQLFGRTSRA